MQLYTQTAGAVASSDLITASAFTIIVAFSLEGDASDEPIDYNNDFLIADANEYWGIMLRTVSTVNHLDAHIYSGGDVRAGSGFIIDQNTTYVTQMRFSSGNFRIGLDGSAEQEDTSVGNVADVTRAVLLARGTDGNQYAPVKIGEILTYNTDLGASNDAYTYMREKWLNEGGYVAPATEEDIVAGGRTIVLDLHNNQWVSS